MTGGGRGLASLRPRSRVRPPTLGPSGSSGPEVARGAYLPEIWNLDVRLFHLGPLFSFLENGEYCCYPLLYSNS